MNNKQVKRIRKEVFPNAKPIEYKNIERRFRGDVPRDKDGNPLMDKEGKPLPPKMILKIQRVKNDSSLKARTKVKKDKWQRLNHIERGLITEVRKNQVAANA